MSTAPKTNVLQVGATRQGKTLAAARRIVEATDEAAVVLDPHEQSLAQAVLTHADGNLLYERLSEVSTTLRFELLTPSEHPDPAQRHLENQQRAEAFVAILTRRRDMDGLSATPLLEEWIFAAIMLYLFQTRRKPLTELPSAFLPGTETFTALVRDCPLPEIAYKFRQLEKLSPRGLRAEVGSATRLINAVFRSPAFAARCRGGFNLGRFLDQKGKLIIEAGTVGEDTMRAIMGAIILLVIDYAKRRPKPYPPVRIYIDEANNARLVGGPELRGIAETAKAKLFWTFLVQNLDFPGGSDKVLQNCLRHEWFGCPYYDLARKAAIDILAGLPRSPEQSRAEQIEDLTHEIMTLPPGWRWVRDAAGSRKEYVPLLENPWPDWPGLRDAKLKEKLCRIYARPEYGVPATPPSSTSSPVTPPPSSSSPADSSPAERWKHRRKKPDAGSANNGDAGACA